MWLYCAPKRGRKERLKEEERKKKSKHMKNLVVMTLYCFKVNANCRCFLITHETSVTYFLEPCGHGYRVAGRAWTTGWRVAGTPLL